MLVKDVLGQHTSEEQFAEWVDAIRTSLPCAEELVVYLPEQHSLYTGRSTKATMRMRGYILAAFEQVGLPDSALPYVLEELENGRDAYLVAAAAKALRGFATPMGELAPYLITAIHNIKYVDDALSFESYRPHWPVKNYTTALRELLRTLAWLGAEAESALAALQAWQDNDEELSRKIKNEIANVIHVIQSAKETEPARCCSSMDSQSGTGAAYDSCCSSVKLEALPVVAQRPEQASCCGDSTTNGEQQLASDIAKIEMEDQEGRLLKYDNYFGSHPAIVTFFYTRCENPNKCSLTITKLAHLQELIAGEGLEGKIQTAAFTYDPGFDLPARLKEYGEARGVVFDEHNRFFRVRDGLDQLQSYFQLGVNYNGSIVNRHRTELFILDQTGNISRSMARLQWDPQVVLDSVKTLMYGSGDSSCRAEVSA